MTTYTVHVYREMRLVYPGIEATSVEAAAHLASQKPTSEADKVEDAEGRTFAALVDVEGDTEYEQSRCIDTDDGRLLDAAADLLGAIAQAVAALNTAPRFRVPSLGTDSYAIAALCDAAIAKAKGGAQ